MLFMLFHVLARVASISFPCCEFLASYPLVHVMSIHDPCLPMSSNVLPGASGIVESFDNLLQNHATLLFLKRLCRISFGYPDGKHIRIQRVLGDHFDHFIYMTTMRNMTPGEPGYQGEAKQSAEQRQNRQNGFEAATASTASTAKDSNDSTDSTGSSNGDGNASECFRYAIHHFLVPEGNVKAALGQADEITLRLAFPLDACTDHDSVARAHSQRQCSQSPENSDNP